MVKKTKIKNLVGWEEWCSFPELQLPAIKAKIDTGATTSALHAYNIKVVLRKGVRYVKFSIHPIQKTKKISVQCVAKVKDKRLVSDSGGHREKRVVIETPMQIGDMLIPIEITLTNRDSMAFRMLLGRQALRKAKLLVDPGKSFRQGKIHPKVARKMYLPEA
jgi:hypothetical protein